MNTSKFTSELDGVITVRLRNSRQFNFSLHIKIKRIKFEDKFLIKTNKNVRSYCQKTAKKIFNKRKEANTERHSANFGLIGSTERTVISGRLFCAIFSFTR